MKKFQVTIHFEMDGEFKSHLPSHRAYISKLIEKGVVDQYVVSLETQRVWITVTAEDKNEVEDYLSRSPVYKYWSFEIDELLVYDGRNYRLPSLQFN